MRRFFEPALITGQEHLSIQDKEEFHHLVHVLRLKPHDTFELGNGKGLVARVEITAISGHALEVKVLSSVSFPIPQRKVILACAIPKKAKFETIIEKATELGIDEIIPLVTQRTEAAGKASEWEKKNERFIKTAIEAMKQCRRPWLPEIKPIMRFEKALEMIAASPDKVMFIPWLEGERKLLSDALKTAGAGNIVFFIGPEGDFTPDEVKLAKAKGALPVSLGENILKVDTAAFYVTTLARSIDTHT
jgi:16S rRNA (uracil1498-N3)-methyltransferase